MFGHVRCIPEPCKGELKIMAQIISIIGAGGKTTLIKRMKNQYLGEGKSVLVTTTTHMLREEDTDVSGDIESVLQKIHRDGYCMAGLTDETNPQKICALPTDMLSDIIKHVDIVLIEADGAKHHFVKYPREGEPVIHTDTDTIILVMGLEDINKPVSEVVFRYEYMKNHENMEDTLLTFAFIENVLVAEYMRILKVIDFKGSIKLLFTDIIDGELAFLEYEEARKLYG